MRNLIYLIAAFAVMAGVIIFTKGAVHASEDDGPIFTAYIRAYGEKHGTMTLDPDKVVYHEDDVIYVIVEPEPGYRVSKIEMTYDDNGYAEDITESKRFLMPPTNVYVNVYFEAYMIKSAWQKSAGKWYYFDEYGSMVTGWKKISGKWYYFKSTHEMAANEWCKGYWLNKNGTCTYTKKAAWHKAGKRWWYGNSSWYAKKQWQKIDDQWYYFKGDGYMATGWTQIGGKWYYFTADGKYVSGWQTINKVRYHFNEDGYMDTGLQIIDYDKYYFDKNGKMVTGWKTLSGKCYYFGEDGIAVTGAQVINGTVYYFDSDGVLVTGE